ncbi:hypothetical protein D3C87_948930 [compost metagenome]
MITRHLEIFALVADLVNLGGIGEDAPVTVAQHRAFFPASLEKLVEHFDIFGGDFVAVIVTAQAALADILRTAFQIGGHDIPADPAFGVVIGGRESARKCVGMFERGGSRNADAQMFRRQRNGGGKLQRIIDRYLRRLMKGVIVRPFVDVVIAYDVGDEDAVEHATFQRSGQILPIIEILVFPGFIAWMRPKPGRLVANAIHVEGIEADGLAHAELPDMSQPRIKSAASG